MPLLGIYTKIITHEWNQRRLQREVARLADEELSNELRFATI